MYTLKYERQCANAEFKFRVDSLNSTILWPYCCELDVSKFASNLTLSEFLSTYVHERCSSLLWTVLQAGKTYFVLTYSFTDLSRVMHATVCLENTRSTCINSRSQCFTDVTNILPVRGKWKDRTVAAIILMLNPRSAAFHFICNANLINSCVIKSIRRKEDRMNRK